MGGFYNGIGILGNLPKPQNNMQSGVGGGFQQGMNTLMNPFQKFQQAGQAMGTTAKGMGEGIGELGKLLGAL